MIYSQYASYYKTHYSAIPFNTVTVRVTMRTTCRQSAFHPNTFVQVSYIFVVIYKISQSVTKIATNII